MKGQIVIFSNVIQPGMIPTCDVGSCIALESGKLDLVNVKALIVRICYRTLLYVATLPPYNVGITSRFTIPKFAIFKIIIT